MNKSIFHSRSFRIATKKDDDIHLKFKKKSANSIQEIDHKANVTDISLSGVSFETNIGSEQLKKNDLLNMKLSFEDYYLSLTGEVVRVSEVETGLKVAVRFNFEEGQTFELFFKRFIKTFSNERVKEQLIKLVEEQGKSEYNSSSLVDLILNLHHQIDHYSELEKFHETVLLQWKHNLNSDLILCINPMEIESGKFMLNFDYDGNNYTEVVSESVLIDCYNERKTLSAFIFNDDFMSRFSKLTGKNIMSFVSEPIIENNQVEYILLVARCRLSKYDSHDLLLLKQGAELISNTLFKKNQVISENVKFLNPNKPRKFAMVGQDEKIQDLRRLIEGTKLDNMPVLLTGNKGTGKKLLAQIIHSESRLSHKEFLHLDASRSQQLDQFKAIFSTNKLPLEFIDVGTIFITNIQDLSESDLNTFYENCLNGLSEVRFIISNSENKKGSLLPESILKKIGNNQFHLPDLKDRKGDIPGLIRYLIKIECKKRGYLEKTIDQFVIDQFKSYHWEGNIREIKTAVGRLVEFYSEKKHIDKLPPDSYHLFTIKKNTDFEIDAKSEKIKNVMEKYNISKDDMILLFKRKLILAEINKREGSLKKAALSLGKPLENLEDILEKSSHMSHLSENIEVSEARKAS